MDTDGDTIRPDELLAQLGWVRALARSLVSDPGMTDDVLQQVCLLALQKAPRGARTGAGLRAWLSVVTRSLARRSARSHVRRVRREQAAARPERLPSTVEIAAQREALTALVGAVAGLEGLYFTVIVERYVEGRSVADIAERQQITSAAVRQRLSRAKTQLRARLERVLSDDRSGWLQAVLPLAPASVSPGTAGAKSVLDHLGGTVMAQKAGASGLGKIAAAILVVGGLGFVTWRGLRDEGVAGGAPQHVIPVESFAARSPPAAQQLPPDAVAQPASLLAVPAASPVARLVGRVTLRDTGAPVAGLRVQPLFDSSSVEPALTHDVTDADGHFTFALREACVVQSISVDPGPETRGLTRALDLRLAPGAETVQDLEVSRGATVSGRVEDQAGRPVAEARVRSWNGMYWTLAQSPDTPPTPPDREVVTDGAGAFSIGGLGPTCLMAVEAPGQTGLARLTGDLADGARADGVTLTLGPVREIRGLILGADERPAADCVIVAEPEAGEPGDALSGVPGMFLVPPPRVSARSDGDGRFVLAGLADRPYVVTVSSRRDVSWTGRHAPGDADLLIRLHAGATLRGRVDSALGGPVGDAEVTACSVSSGPWPRPLRTTTTDADGFFELVGLDAAADGLLLVRAPNHALDVEQHVEIAAGEPSQVRIVLDEARALGGTIVDGNDQPVVGVAVAIQGDRILPVPSGMTLKPLPAWETLFSGANATVTDKQGRFRFGQLYDGMFELRVAEPEGQGTAAVVVAESGSEDLRIVLDSSRPAGVTLVGTVSDALTGRPMERFSIIPMIPSGAGGMTGDDYSFESAEGSFRIAGLPPGTIEPLVRAPGYAEQHLPTRDDAAGEHRLDLQLSAERVLRLRVVDEDHEPVSARLSFLDERGSPLMVKSAANMGTTLLETDAQGEAIAMGLPAARVTVHVKQGWFGGGQKYAFDLLHEVRGTQVLVYGDDGKATVMVFFFGSSEAAAVEPAGTSLQDSMQSLQKRIEAGTVYPLAAAITVRARTADGRVVAEETIDPRSPGDSTTPIPEVSGPCNVRLTVPAEPLEFEISSDGHAPARVAWQPNRADDTGDVLVVTLRKS
jgi:RNA polymerase sigma factor (sigma-70 family)